MSTGDPTWSGSSAWSGGARGARDWLGDGRDPAARRRPGLDGFLRVCDRNVPAFLFHLDLIVVTQLDRPVTLARRPRSLVVSEADERDLRGLSRVFGREALEFGLRVAAGHTAFVCRAGEDLIGMCWVDLGPKHEEPDKFADFLVPADSAWGYDLFVVPDWQLSGAAALLLEFAFDYIRRRGRTRMFGYASRHNEASLRTHYSFGHRPILVAFVMNLLGLRVHRFRRVVDPSGAKTVVSLFSRPTIELQTLDVVDVAGTERSER